MAEHMDEQDAACTCPEGRHSPASSTCPYIAAGVPPLTREQLLARLDYVFNIGPHEMFPSTRRSEGGAGVPMEDTSE